MCKLRRQEADAAFEEYLEDINDVHSLGVLFLVRLANRIQSLAAVEQVENRCLYYPGIRQDFFEFVGFCNESVSWQRAMSLFDYLTEGVETDMDAIWKFS